MVVSDNRLVKVVPPWQQKYIWPVSEPADNLDYYLDITAALDDVADEVDHVTVAVAPSGDGEISIGSVEYDQGIVTVWASGGVLGRLYTFNLKIYCLSNRQFSFFIELPISINSLVEPPGPPESPYYSQPVST
jgi:hypothetical protein